MVMYSKIKIFGHPLHPMLVSFPIAFYTATLVAFITYAATGNIFWFRLAYTANAAGVVMALVAALPGFLDWLLGIPDKSQAKKHGLQHMLLNVSALAFFAINLWLYSGQWNAPRPAAALSILLPAIGFVLTLMAGYFGWTLVQTHHSGVQFSPAEESCLRGKAEPEARPR
ncbi:MAG: DUF2231 domain-containing protein [Desulfobacteraceae bacterium]|nr:MAG: DUF2231 domain-containing protein [Desulfobacteraceae bacterium]